MAGLPDDVTAVLVRALGTYIREQPANELPSHLRRFRSFRPQGLNAHKDPLLAALEDEALRARIGHWLKNEKPPLSKDEVRVLTIATERGDGWEAELSRSAKPGRKKAGPKVDDEGKLEAEREKARRAKEEARKARDELHTARRESAARIAELEARIAELEQRVAVAERRSSQAERQARRAVEQVEREQRRVKTATEKIEKERDAAKKEARELRRELQALKAKPLPKPPPPTSERKRSGGAPKKRRPLRVPKGRLEDAPETLRAWLERDDVVLVIDGYNVAKADGGFEDLQLESQRERLVDAVFTLVKMTDTETIVVFDAQRVPGRRAKKTKRPMQIEWSGPGEIADDYIVKKIENLPQHPVILVTNDRELQERGRALSATIATSQQLLALIR